MGFAVAARAAVVVVVVSMVLVVIAVVETTAAPGAEGEVVAAEATPDWVATARAISSAKLKGKRIHTQTYVCLYNSGQTDICNYVCLSNPGRTHIHMSDRLKKRFTYRVRVVGPD